jgi:hypothetical protein
MEKRAEDCTHSKALRAYRSPPNVRQVLECVQSSAALVLLPFADRHFQLHPAECPQRTTLEDSV